MTGDTPITGATPMTAAVSAAEAASEAGSHVEAPQDAGSEPVTPQEPHAWVNADTPPPLQSLPAAVVGVTGMAPVIGRHLIR